jgi:hypothetical protein
MWMYLWDTSATQIQCALRKWYACRRYTKFRRGCVVMKRVFRGQVRRRQLRGLVGRLQAALDDPGLDTRRTAALIAAFDTDEWPFFVDLYAINRLCSGNTVFPGMSNYDDIYMMCYTLL